jgi:competence protein ComEC
VIDAGTHVESLDMGRAVIAPFLWDRGIRKIDQLVITHPQLDHAGGAAYVVRHFEIGEVWTNGIDRNEPFYRSVLDAMAERGLVPQTAVEGTALAGRSGCDLRVLNPSQRPLAVLTSGQPSGRTLNNASIVTKLQCGRHSVLFTADIERETIARLSASEDFDAEIIKVPHHGAVSSYDPTWIHASRARVAVVSVGRSNSYGHPAPGVTDAYQREGITLLRTDLDGAVTVQFHPDDPSVDIHRAVDSLLRAVPRTSGWFRTEWMNLHRLVSLDAE